MAECSRSSGRTSEERARGILTPLAADPWNSFGMGEFRYFVNSLPYPRRRNPLPQNRLLPNLLLPLLPLFSFASF